MRVVVVGGGLAGLFVANELVASGMEDVVVVDRSDEAGGVARTMERDGFALEPAVSALTLPHPHLSPILERIGVEMVPVAPTALARQVYADGRLISIPASPRALTAPLVPWPSKLRALAEPLIPKRNLPDESLIDFCCRRFGRGAGAMIAWLMATGVYAGDPQQLSARAAFPLFSGLEQEAGSVVRGALARRRRRPSNTPRPRHHYPAGGMSTLARLAVDALGGRYRGGFEVETIRREDGIWSVSGSETLRADSVILATGPGRAAELVDETLAAHLRGAKSARVVVVGLGGHGTDPLPDGFGVLIGPGEAMLSRGLLYESSYAPERAPEGAWLLKVIAGGSPTHGWGDDLAEVVRGEAETILGRKLITAFTTVVDDLPGIPQYTIGHARWLEKLDGLLETRTGLHVTGWAYRGVGVSHLATDAVRVAKVVLSR